MEIEQIKPQDDKITEKEARYKVDSYSDFLGFWWFSVYEKKSFLGIKYWSRISSTESTEIYSCERYIKQRKRVPIYV